METNRTKWRKGNKSVQDVANDLSNCRIQPATEIDLLITFVLLALTSPTVQRGAATT